MHRFFSHQLPFLLTIIESCGWHHYDFIHNFQMFFKYASVSCLHIPVHRVCRSLSQFSKFHFVVGITNQIIFMHFTMIMRLIQVINPCGIWTFTFEPGNKNKNKKKTNQPIKWCRWIPTLEVFWFHYDQIWHFVCTFYIGKRWSHYRDSNPISH